MKHTLHIRILALLLTVLGAAHTAKAQPYCPVNINLEQGTLSGWRFATAINRGTSGVSTFANVLPISTRHTLTSGAGTDFYGGFPVVDPVGGTYSLKVGNDNTNAEVDRAQYTFTVPATTNNYSIVYRYAVVFENPAHVAAEQPWFKVRVYDSATGANINCASFTYVASGTLPGFIRSTKYGQYGGSIVFYKPWATASLNLSGQAGKTLVLEFTAADCSLGGHMGYGYVDVSCGLFAISSSTCNATSPLSAPPGFQTYTWYNSTFGTVVGTGQSITVPTPSTKTKYHVVLTPFAGYGCVDTLTTEIFGSTLAVNAGPDAMVCNASSVALNPTVTGNAGPYTYAWSPSSSLSCASCSSPAASPTTTTNYVVSVTDTLGCVKRDTVQVKPAPVVTATATPASCFGAANGSVSATAASGTAPYTYSWNTTPAVNAASSNGLVAGSYTVTATDANGCRVNASTTVAQPARIAASISSIDSVSCNGGTDGRATATVIGGKAPFTYSWNTTPAKTTATAGQLSAASYIVTVTDSLGCSDTESVVIPQPARLTMSFQKTPVRCFGAANGSVSITAGGGTAPYSYAIGSGAFSSNSNFSNLAPGSYTLHLRDSKSCVLDSQIVITQAPAMQVTATTTQPLCFGAANGQINLNVTGGIAPYQYAFNTGAYGSSNQATNLAAGTYAIHVRDSAGCQFDSGIVLSQPQALAIVLTATNATCNNSATGSVNGSANGGTAPYQFAIDNGAFGSGNSFNALSAGTHILRVRDAAGCTKDSSFSISQPSALAMSFSSFAPACNGAANGTIQITAAGGNAPYQYALNNGAFATTASFSGLNAGTFVLHLRDASGCTLDSMIVLQQPNSLNASFTVTPVSCANGSNGAINIIANGGTAPYSYAVNSGSFSANSGLNTLSAGTYIVRIRDAKNCQIDSQIVIAQPAPVQLSWTATEPLCNGAANGQISMSATGGTSPYQFAVNTGSYSSTNTASALVAGAYTIHVRDAAGCQADSNIVLRQPQVLALNLSATSPACFGTNGSVNGTATGGTAPYAFAIDNGTFGSSAQFGSLTAGTHILRVRDAAGCTKDSGFSIAQPAALAMNISATAPACNGAANGQIAVTATGGSAPYLFALNNAAFASTASFSALNAGTFVVRLRDVAGCTLDSTIALQQPNGLTATFSVTPVNCANGSDAAIAVTAAGGSAPYTYAVNGGSYGSSNTASNLGAGSYTIHVRDSKNCQIDSMIVIAQPAAMQLSWTATQPLCNGAATGQITLNAAGGTAPYQYAFNTGSYGSTAQATNLSAGTYALHVRDARGCQADTTTILAQPQAISLNLAVTNNVCHNIAAGAVTATTTGGTAPYQYALNSGAFGNSAQFGALAAGSYVLHVRDASGCTKDSAFSLTQPAALAMSITASAPACSGNNSGMIQVSATGGQSPYQLSINNGAFGSSNSFSSLAAGNYTIRLRDNLGCTLDSAVQLQQPGSLSATATQTAVSCNGGNNGTIQISATGGTAPYAYAWNGSAATTSARSGLTAGSYTATVTDSKGCTYNVTSAISQPAAIATTVTTTNPSCNGANNGAAAATITGGTAPYSYSWSGSTQTTASVTGYAAGSYTLTVTDAASCSGSFPLTIGAGPAVQVQSGVVNPTCFDGTDGKAFVTVAGATGPFSYNWQGLSGQTTDTAHGLSAGTYTVTVSTAAGCTATDTVVVKNPGKMTVQIVSRGTCTGSAQGSLTASVNGGVAPYQYKWNTVPALPTATASNLSAGAYSVVVTDALGCKDSVDAIVSNSTGFAIHATTSTDTVCRGSQVQLNVNGASSYSWSPASWMSCATCPNPTATVDKDTTFTVIGMDENGCRDTAQVRVAVMHRAPAHITPDVRICFGQTATLRTTGGQSRIWMTAEAQTDSVIHVAPKESTRYGVAITENRCFRDTLYQNVEVLPTPSVEIGDDIQAPVGKEVTLHANMENASRITWFPAQGLSCDNCAEPVHKVTGKTSYVATVTNDLGCTATDTVHITDVCDEKDFYFANMFSPNADGNNDRFYPQGAGDIRIDHFMIYNRWGEVVFSARNINANDANAGWDGTFRNEQLKADVFVYVMDAVCAGGKKIVIRGDVTLVR